MSGGRQYDFLSLNVRNSKGLSMRAAALTRVVGAALCLLHSSAIFASNHSSAEFPLRIHIYHINARAFYSSNRTVDFFEGEGRANLFERGDPRGFDFGFRCSAQVMTSSGYETYPARWKKQDATLEVLLPVMGKPNATNACELKVAMKPDKAYHTRNGIVYEEPAALYKEWMLKVQYDPEHGKNEPQQVPSTPAGTNTNAK